MGSTLHRECELLRCWIGHEISGWQFFSIDISSYFWVKRPTIGLNWTTAILRRVAAVLDMEQVQVQVLTRLTISEAITDFGTRSRSNKVHLVSTVPYSNTSITSESVKREAESERSLWIWKNWISVCGLGSKLIQRKYANEQVQL